MYELVFLCSLATFHSCKLDIGQLLVCPLIQARQGRHVGGISKQVDKDDTALVCKVIVDAVFYVRAILIVLIDKTLVLLLEFSRDIVV